MFMLERCIYRSTRSLFVILPLVLFVTNGLIKLLTGFVLRSSDSSQTWIIHQLEFRCHGKLPNIQMRFEKQNSFDKVLPSDLSILASKSTCSINLVTSSVCLAVTTMEIKRALSLWACVGPELRSSLVHFSSCFIKTSLHGLSPEKARQINRRLIKYKLNFGPGP